MFQHALLSAPSPESPILHADALIHAFSALDVSVDNGTNRVAEAARLSVAANVGMLELVMVVGDDDKGLRDLNVPSQEIEAYWNVPKLIGVVEIPVNPCVEIS